MTNLSVNIDQLEKQRFTQQLLDENCDFYFHQDKRSLLSRCKFKHAKQVFIWGRRPPDIEAFKLACKTAKTIVILQHAKNPRREKVPLSYYAQNFKKVAYWISSMSRLKLARLNKRKKSASAKVLLFYFTDSYKKEWQQHFSKGLDVEFIECAKPDSSSFGTIKQTEVCMQPISCFYVDEPLTTTLGISVEQENALLHSLQQEVEDTIHVKLHPRSNPDKFNNLPHFKVVNQIYKNAHLVAGYRSALLDFDFSNQQTIRLNNELVWQMRSIDKRCQASQDYISQIKEYLKKHDI